MRPELGLQLAADLIDQARLAGAVRPDDDMPLARRDIEADIVGHDEAAERLIEMIEA